jgi:hypothetical protein
LSVAIYPPSLLAKLSAEPIGGLVHHDFWWTFQRRENVFNITAIVSYRTMCLDFSSHELQARRRFARQLERLVSQQFN